MERTRIGRSLAKNAGFSLVEIMIAVSVITIAFLSVIATFNAISGAIQSTKNRTLATNLAQEKIQILRQVSYNRLMVTPSPQYRTEFSSPIAYDNTYYKPEAILEGGITYERLTYVQMAAESGGSLVYLGATPDTGMKAVTITVLWKQAGEYRKVQVKSVIANSDAVKNNAAVKGYVLNNANGLPIVGANVYASDNPAWRAATDSSGYYLIRIYDGDYVFYAEARGFFSQSKAAGFAVNETKDVSFSLIPMSSGTIRGTAWLNDHPVISQVVGSSSNAAGLSQEYVELFNPTTAYVRMTDAAGSAFYRIMYQLEDTASPSEIPLTYKVLNSSIPPGSYYLIANTQTVVAFGASKQADAYYTALGADVIKIPFAGGVGLQRISDSGWADRVGWNRNPGTPKQAPLKETAGVPQVIGFQDNEQYIRLTSTAGVAAGYARCYDSDDNSIDIKDVFPMVHAPKNSSDSETIIAGTPAIGAVVTCNDGLSYPLAVGAAGSPPYAEYVLTSVATGQWSVSIASGVISTTISTITVLTHGATVFAPWATTNPAWPAAGYNSALLKEEKLVGYISGRITNAYGAAISVPSAVKAAVGATSQTANPSTGRYILTVATGVYSVTANPGSENALYMTQTKDYVSVNPGIITSGVDFVLSQAGIVSGWITKDGINPLPDVSVTALDSDGAVRGVGMSAQNGRFSILNLSTGAYTVKPELDAKETSTPDEIPATIILGSNIFIGTFTVVDAFGKITGRVRNSGRAISTGVMVVASNGSISTTNPPALSSGLSQLYYITNSYEDGTYSLDVRGSTVSSYNMAAFFPSASKSKISVSTRTASNVWVAAGTTTANINFDW